MKKAFVTSGAMSGMIKQMFMNNGWTIVTTLDDADLLVLSGGEDVDPSTYSTWHHPTTSGRVTRDEYEAKLVWDATDYHDIPVVGICRGAQLLNVMNGGGMWQDVNNHAGPDHLMTMVGTGATVMVSSLHHQMMIPDYDNPDCIIIATANEATRKERCPSTEEAFAIIKEEGKTSEVEVLYYADMNWLCYQPHPELSVGYGEHYKDMVSNFFNLINEYLFDGDHD